ncbi:MAG: hypothetical protein II297_02565 [Clostridia bacterium]|nr:hypothetical protein [Clostridia bacterium]
MKKLVSLLVALTLLVACFATTAFAANSPVGNITVTDVAGVEVDGGNLTAEALEQLAEEFVLEIVEDIKTNWIEPISTTAGIQEKVGVADYKLFQGAKLVLSEVGVKILAGEQVLKSAAPKVATIADTAAKATIKTTTVTLNVPGITEANAPKVVSYDPETKAYTPVATTVAGSNVSATVPVASDNVAYIAVIYTGAATSPETNVAAWAFGVVAIVALAGAVYAGKKVFAA